MEDTHCSPMEKFKGGKASNEYALYQKTETNYIEILDTVFNQYYYIVLRPKKSDRFLMFLSNPQDKQALSKIAKLVPKAEKLEYIAFYGIQKNNKKLNKLLSQLKVKKLKRLYLDANYPDSVLFSFYARNIARRLPLVTGQIRIKNFRVSHRDFGRVLIACGSSPSVQFQRCRIIINGFDYLDNVQPSIGNISLEYNTIIQPEEDNEFLDGFIQKMADSSLSESLKHVSVGIRNPGRRAKRILPKKKYTIGNFDVDIYSANFYSDFNR
ncbi:unnamed protein product [Moneuplotes crassus]|uniref:Uncharacterized protein n=1 Tax=Euplotes crassus TaxID=5936 RepID=A0AAD1XUF4_EUPCR|nr:unnamed protein product [Moneuplotes crassus]